MALFWSLQPESALRLGKPIQQSASMLAVRAWQEDEPLVYRRCERVLVPHLGLDEGVRVIDRVN